MPWRPSRRSPTTTAAARKRCSMPRTPDMTAFVSLAAVLTLLVVARLLWPLWRGSRRSTLTVSQLNSKVYRDQLQELERDLARGQLTEAAYQEPRDELQRRLLQDVAPAADTPQRTAPAGRWTAVLLAAPA